MAAYLLPAILLVVILVASLSLAILYYITAKRYLTAETKIDATLNARLKDPIFKARVETAKAVYREIEALADELTAELSKAEVDVYQPNNPEQKEKLIRKLLGS